MSVGVFPTNQVPCQLLRLVYVGMLAKYPRSDVSLFWSEISLSVGREPDSFLKEIWRGTGKLAAGTVPQILNSLESWLLERGQAPKKFIEDAFFDLIDQPGPAMRSMLWQLRPYLDHLHRTSDIRLLLLKLLDEIQLVSEAPIRHQLVAQSIRYGHRSDIVLFSWLRNEGFNPAFRYDYWIAPVISLLPKLFLLPPFEEIRMLADTRPLPALPDLVEMEGEVSSLGKVVAHRMGFHEFCRQHGLDPVSLRLADSQGLVWAKGAEAMFGRQFQEGCFYGAPVHLAEYRYSSALGRSHNPLEHLVGGLVESENAPWNRLAEVHELLLSELAPALEVVYHSGDDSISINSRHLVRSVPAKILRNVFRRLMSEGRYEFEHREFRRDPEICMDPLNPNFEARLGRLMERLDASGVPVCIKKHRRGAFLLELGANVRFRED